ncbi:MAG: hypothetical protein LCH93_04145 [Proteobacteria bacterium]|nr:hypothetical protein [Pseudomonadota bacterium]
MAFKTVLDRTFKHRVAVQVPVDGGHKEETFKATFRLLDAAAIEDFDLGSVEGTSDFLRAVIVDMDELVKEDNTPDQYCDDLRDKIILFTPARVALVRAYFDGAGKGRRKN